MRTFGAACLRYSGYRSSAIRRTREIEPAVHAVGKYSRKHDVATAVWSPLHFSHETHGAIDGQANRVAITGSSGAGSPGVFGCNVAAVIEHLIPCRVDIASLPLATDRNIVKRALVLPRLLAREF